MGLLRSIFQAPRYRQFLLLGHSKHGLFWEYQTWSNSVFPSLDRLILSAEHSPSIHCGQVTRLGSKAVKFGKIKWSAEDSKVWCHNSDVTQGICDKWIFIDLQVFSPRRDILVRDIDFPTIFVHMMPLAWEGVPSRAGYDQAIFVALKGNFYEGNAEAVDAIIGRLAESIAAVKVYCGMLRATSLNMFESVVREDFMYKGMLADELPDKTKMKGSWWEWS